MSPSRFSPQQIIMAQVQPRLKLVKKSMQQVAPIETTSLDQDQIVSEQQSFAMVQTTLQTSVRPSPPNRLIPLLD